MLQPEPSKNVNILCEAILQKVNLTLPKEIQLNRKLLNSVPNVKKILLEQPQSFQELLQVAREAGFNISKHRKFNEFMSQVGSPFLEACETANAEQVLNLLHLVAVETRSSKRFLEFAKCALVPLAKKAEASESLIPDLCQVLPDLINRSSRANLGVKRFLLDHLDLVCLHIEQAGIETVKKILSVTPGERINKTLDIMLEVASDSSLLPLITDTHLYNCLLRAEAYDQSSNLEVIRVFKNSMGTIIQREGLAPVTRLCEILLDAEFYGKDFRRFIGEHAAGINYAMLCLGSEKALGLLENCRSLKAAPEQSLLKTYDEFEKRSEYEDKGIIRFAKLLPLIANHQHCDELTSLIKDFYYKIEEFKRHDASQECFLAYTKLLVKFAGAESDLKEIKKQASFLSELFAPIVGRSYANIYFYNLGRLSTGIDSHSSKVNSLLASCRYEDLDLYGQEIIMHFAAIKDRYSLESSDRYDAKQLEEFEKNWDLLREASQRSDTANTNFIRDAVYPFVKEGCFRYMYGEPRKHIDSLLSYGKFDSEFWESFLRTAKAVQFERSLYWRNHEPVPLIFAYAWDRLIKAQNSPVKLNWESITGNTELMRSMMYVITKVAPTTSDICGILRVCKNAEDPAVFSSIMRYSMARHKLGLRFLYPYKNHRPAEYEAELRQSLAAKVEEFLNVSPERLITVNDAALIELLPELGKVADTPAGYKKSETFSGHFSDWKSYKYERPSAVREAYFLKPKQALIWSINDSKPILSRRFDAERITFEYKRIIPAVQNTMQELFGRGNSILLSMTSLEGLVQHRDELRRSLEKEKNPVKKKLVKIHALEKRITSLQAYLKVDQSLALGSDATDVLTQIRSLQATIAPASRSNGNILLQNLISSINSLALEEGTVSYLRWTDSLQSFMDAATQEFAPGLMKNAFNPIGVGIDMAQSPLTKRVVQCEPISRVRLNSEGFTYYADKPRELEEMLIRVLERPGISIKDFVVATTDVCSVRLHSTEVLPEIVHLVIQPHLKELVIISEQQGERYEVARLFIKSDSSDPETSYIMENSGAQRHTCFAFCKRLDTGDTLVIPGAEAHLMTKIESEFVHSKADRLGLALVSR